MKKGFRTKIKFLILLIVVTSSFLKSYGQWIDCKPPIMEDGYSRFIYTSFDPYSIYSVVSSPVFVKRIKDSCSVSNTYLFENNGFGNKDTLRIIKDLCYPENSKYFYSKINYKRSDINEDEFYPSETVYSGQLIYLDSAHVIVDGVNYPLEKYKVEIPNKPTITIYYCDTLGLVKQYNKVMSSWRDNIELEWLNDCFETRLMKAYFSVFLNNTEFHKRFDGGPRTVQLTIIDKKKFRKSRKTYEYY